MVTKLKRFIDFTESQMFIIHRLPQAGPLMALYIQSVKTKKHGRELSLRHIALNFTTATSPHMLERCSMCLPIGFKVNAFNAHRNADHWETHPHARTNRI